MRVQPADDGTVVPGSVSNESLGTSATFVPSSPLTASTHYTVKVSGAQSSGGTPMAAPVVTHFRTSGVASCPCSVFASGARPLGGAGQAAYWLPVIALYSGARRNEIAQLRVGDGGRAWTACRSSTSMMREKGAI